MKKSRKVLTAPQSDPIGPLAQIRQRLEDAERLIAEQEQKIRLLEDLASTDPLTGLMNRRGFDAFFAQELSRIRRGNSPGALLVLIDLDHFKDINDRHGHEAGDACLKRVAQYLLSSIRITDGAARLGGDEFALLLTQTDQDGAQARAEKIRGVLGDMHLHRKGGKLPLRASFGVKAIDEKSDYAEAFRAADHALYRDKKKKKK